MVQAYQETILALTNCKKDLESRKIYLQPKKSTSRVLSSQISETKQNKYFFVLMVTLEALSETEKFKTTQYNEI